MGVGTWIADGPIEPGSVSSSSARRGTAVRVTTWLNVIDVPNTNEPVGVSNVAVGVAARVPPGSRQADQQDRAGQDPGEGRSAPPQPGSAVHGAHARPAKRMIPRPLSEAPRRPVAGEGRAGPVGDRDDRDLVLDDRLGRVERRAGGGRVGGRDRLGDRRVELGRAPVAVVVRAAGAQEQAQEVVRAGVVGDPAQVQKAGGSVASRSK